MFISISQKIITVFFHNITMVRFGEKEIEKENFYAENKIYKNLEC